MVSKFFNFFDSDTGYFSLVSLSTSESQKVVFLVATSRLIEPQIISIGLSSGISKPDAENLFAIF